MLLQEDAVESGATSPEAALRVPLRAEGLTEVGATSECRECFRAFSPRSATQRYCTRGCQEVFEKREKRQKRDGLDLANEQLWRWLLYREKQRYLELSDFCAQQRQEIARLRQREANREFLEWLSKNPTDEERDARFL
jgi:predicted nucleic acid-binding Zn ribbon protein